ncbi:hypothetical protein Goarm_013068 [Gossypium armourianum]|uniref:Protein NRT1/ PTR FAMILY 4.6-like n=1 Tax=Gossypium armourianum TaxID=34283 RepID=A0A7J9J1X1_9ROSI|nr:hypothetical protein [Gossypium armourianum]
MVAASFVLVVEVLENLAYLANSSNLVLYLSKHMHLSPSKSANDVTNFMGTAFLLALLGGFLSDTFFTTYHIYLISALIQFLVHEPRGRPLIEPKRNLKVYLTENHAHPAPFNITKPCRQQPVHQPPPFHAMKLEVGKAVMLFTGLYLVALGVGGIKGSLPTHGAEQFDANNPQGRKQRSTFFNYFVFCLSFGALIAVTFVVWVEDNMGWEWGFSISTIAVFLSVAIFLAGSAVYRNKIPFGSPLTTIGKVLVAAMLNSCMSKNPKNAIANLTTSPSYRTETCKERDHQIPTESLKVLNRAAVNKPAYPALECSVQQVEEVKIVLKIFPIFACTIFLNCCLAQLSTFSVEQAATMNTKLGSLKIPPASLPVFPVVFIMILAPLYDHFIIPFARRVTKTEMGITHLQRIGIGLFLSMVAMAVAALVEIKRKPVATYSGLLDSTNPLPITFLWIALQYLFLGSADLFTLAGLLEFFFTEAPSSMRSLATSLSWTSLAMGYYLSSVIVSIVNNVSENSGHKPWLSGHTINGYHLERFYWLMCVLSALNFMHYLLWAMRYKYRSAGSSK